MDHFKVHKHRIIKFLLSISLFSALFSVLTLLLQPLKPFLTMLLLDKSYMFLLCNGLVVFILKNSGLIDGKNGMEIENPQAEDKCLMKAEEQEGGLSDEKQGNHALVTTDEDELEHNAEDTEELNKKFEDFIRKTKEAFCSDPRADFNSDDFEFDNRNAQLAVQ